MNVVLQIPIGTKGRLTASEVMRACDEAPNAIANVLAKLFYVALAQANPAGHPGGDPLEQIRQQTGQDGTLGRLGIEWVDHHWRVTVWHPTLAIGHGCDWASAYAAAVASASKTTPNVEPAKEAQVANG